MKQDSADPGERDGSALPVEARLAAVEAGLGTLQAAVAGLHARVAELEGSR